MIRPLTQIPLLLPIYGHCLGIGLIATAQVNEPLNLAFVL